MIRHILIGQTHPQRALLELITVGPLHFTSNFFADVATVTFSIVQSQVVIVIESETDLTTDQYTLKNAMHGMASTIVDVMGYCLGHAYTVEITTLIYPGGESEVFGIDVPALTQCHGDRPFGPTSAVDLTITNLHLRRSMADLRNAVQIPQDTAFYCYRAIETLRHYWSGSEKQQWESMNAALRFDKSAHLRIKDLADDQRHGAAGLEMSEADRVLALTHAWKVMDRFLLLMNSGEPGLPSSRYSIISAS